MAFVVCIFSTFSDFKALSMQILFLSIHAVAFNIHYVLDNAPVLSIQTSYMHLFFSMQAVFVHACNFHSSGKQNITTLCLEHKEFFFW